VVITAGQGEQPGWFAAQDKLATLSSNSAHRTVTDATHTDLLDDESLSANSSRAIHDVVQSVRAGTPLQL
jgi:hypothetical protein